MSPFLNSYKNDFHLRPEKKNENNSNKKCNLKVKTNGVEGTVSLTDDRQMTSFLCNLTTQLRCVQGLSIHDAGIRWPCSFRDFKI